VTLVLKTLTPFASGGNRVCYVHPEHPNRCIKIRRPDFTLEDLRRKKGFPKNLRPLSWFDDNLEEFHVMQDIERRFGDDAFAVLSRCYGFEDTDMGKGLTSELIRNGDGRISHSLKQHVWLHGYKDELKAAVTTFSEVWLRLGIPSRDLLVHNLVVQCNADGSIRRIVAIDGIGSPNLIPDNWLPKRARFAKVARKINNLHERINELLASRARNDPLGTLGILVHDGKSTPPTS
jgi:hypothetical protein